MKIRLLVGVLALGAIASCTKSNTTVLESVNAKIFVQARATAERNVGKTFWLATDLLVCDKPTLITETKCEVVDRNTRLEVDGVEQGFNEENGVPAEWHITTLRPLMAGQDTCWTPHLIEQQQPWTWRR